MLVSVTDDETRIAIVEDNLLQELLIEHQNREQNKGNIYKGRVVQVQTAVQAAFVDYGQKRHGFLPLSEVNPEVIGSKKEKRGRARLEEGQDVLVQVTREEVDHKGAALTTNLSLAGRYMVMMPHTDKGGVSKRISDPDERERLKGFLAGIGQEAHSVIIRTAGMHRDLSELKKDYTQVKRLWEEIKSRYEAQVKPSLVHEELDVITRSLRDYYNEEIDEVWVDQPESFQKVLAFLKENAPRRQKDLKLFVGDRSLFATYNIEKQVEQLTSRKVKLRSGGSIVIDQTEALVAIDVNSGRSNQESNVENTALRTNLEAAAEVARQLRLRNLGGIIVVDFIDMDKASSKAEVEAVMAEAFERDRAQNKIGHISEFGLMEISRQRMAQRISSVIESECPFCQGKGMVPSLLASANLILRTIREYAAKGGVSSISGELPLEVANHLLNERRQFLMDLEMEFGIIISLLGNPALFIFDERNLKVFNEEGQVISSGVVGGSGSRRRGRRGRRREEEPEVAKESEEVDEESLSQEEESSEEADRPKKHRRRKRRRRGEREQEEGVELELEATATAEGEPEALEEEPPTPKRERQTALKEEEEEDDSFYAGFANEQAPIHPGCLFPEVREIDDVFRQEVAESFYQRLRGKAKGQPPRRIGERFLWRAVPASLKAREEAPAKGKKSPSQGEEESPKPPKKRATKAATKKKETLPEDQTQPEAQAKPKRAPRKKAVAVKAAPEGEEKPKRAPRKKAVAVKAAPEGEEKPKRAPRKKAAAKGEKKE